MEVIAVVIRKGIGDILLCLFRKLLLCRLLID